MRGRSLGRPLRAVMRRAGLQPVHLGHLHVHQHHVVGLALDALDGLDAVAGQVGAVAHLLQQPQRQLLVDHVVLGQQDAQRVARGHAGVDLRLGRRSARAARASLRQQRDQRVEQLALVQRLGQRGGEQAARRSSRRPSELNSTSGSVWPASRMRAASCAPSMPGMCMSRMARSKRSRLAASGSACSGASVSLRHHAPLGGLQRQDAPVGGVVVDHQQALALQRRLLADEVARASPCGSAAGGARIVKWKVEPLPGPALSTHIVPPISSASSLLMARPRPVPPYLRVVLLSAWLKLLEQPALALLRTGRCRCRAPRSAAVRRARPSGCTAQHHLAGFGELDRVAQQVEQDLAQPRHVAVDRPAAPRRFEHIGDVQVLLGRAAGDQVERRFDALAQVEGMAPRCPCARPRSSRSRGCR